ncbi:TRAP transporter large permease [Clostridium sp. AM58-1XD]|uniref:TRAP transporter large permease n=1 Tax=Clostridium sp. AM58-1XD TaxID=2292307 RepID=UPI000E46C378|nr:TRAP transporter large permease [Clostridium sp. AM58-1XD]RGZ00648.1 TRAP transporter large permease [Clostridium sp. AM58-1XD]
MQIDSVAVALLLGIFFGLLLAGVHIFLAVMAASLVTCFYIGVDLQTMTMQVIKGMNVYSLMAVPFFILAGEVMGAGGITDRLVGLSKSLVGWIRGSLAHVNIVASLFFGSISGSSAADTASIGSMMIPMMERDGYDTDFSTCVTMASSVEGMLIPPSHNMVLFALAAGNVSIARLFMAGIVPGFVLAFVLCVYSYIVAIKRNYPKGEKFNLKVAFQCFVKALPGLGTVLIVVVGVLGGIFTATEAAAFAVVYALIVGIFIYREIKLRDIPKIFAKALKTSAIILILIGLSNCFSWLVTYMNVATYVTELIMSITNNTVVILLMINVFLLICGMVMDMAAIILIVTPILLPIVTNLGMEPCHFCAMLILNLGIGLITPPVGNTLFIGSAISGRTVGQLSKAMIPFYIMMGIALVLITYIPQISTFLPNLLGT